MDCINGLMIMAAKLLALPGGNTMQDRFSSLKRTAPRRGSSMGTYLIWGAVVLGLGLAVWYLCKKQKATATAARAAALKSKVSLKAEEAQPEETQVEEEASV